MSSKADILFVASGRTGARFPQLCLCLAVSIFLSLGYWAPARAQMVNPFAGYNGPTLGKDDYTVARGVVAQLLNEAPPEIGRYEHWSNPASGNHGKFTILRIFSSNGMPCRKVSADVIYAKASAAPRSFTLDACKLPSGEWKTVT